MAQEVSIKDDGTYVQVPQPRELSHKLLIAADVQLPIVLPGKRSKITGWKKLVF